MHYRVESANSIDPSFLHYALVAAGGLACSFLTRKESGYPMPDYLKKASTFLSVLGVGWWSMGGMLELYQIIETKNDWYACAAVFWSASLISLLFYSSKAGWETGASWMRALPIGLGAFLILAIIDFSHPLAYLGWLAWPSILVAYLSTLYAFENKGSYLRGLDYHHIAFVWIAAAISTSELYWQASHWLPNHPDLIHIALAIPAIVITLTITQLNYWPLTQHRDPYGSHGAIPLISGLILWWWNFGLCNSGSSSLFFYIPLINPLDITTTTVLFVILQWSRISRWNSSKLQIMTLLLFMTLNAMMFRTLHHWVGVPYSISGIWYSTIAQTTISMVWSIVAVSGMWIASKISGRNLWIACAGLLGIVTAKLLLVDLSNTETLARIISFLGVGFLMLVIGYVSPLPSIKNPTTTQDQAS